jgi:hypothetical protein
MAVYHRIGKCVRINQMQNRTRSGSKFVGRCENRILPVEFTIPATMVRIDWALSHLSLVVVCLEHSLNSVVLVSEPPSILSCCVRESM